MAVFVKRSHDFFSLRGERRKQGRCVGAIPNEQRDARGMAATMDHSNIRGLVTAFHLFFAGLPRSDFGDRPLRDARSKNPRIPLIDPAHRVATRVSSP